MKILEINKFYFIKGGAERHFFDVIDLLESHGDEVAVFAMQHKKNETSEWSKYFPSAAGYSSEYSFWQKTKGVFRMFYSFEIKRKINKLLDDFEPDVVHVHNIYHQLSPMILFEIKKRNIPIVMTVHDYKLINPNYNLYHNGTQYDRCKNGKYYQCLLDKCIKNSYAKSFVAMLEAYWHRTFGTYSKNIDQYIVPSVFVRDILINRGIDQDKMAVISHFVVDDPSVWADVHEEERYALFVGRITEGKSVQDIVQIFENIQNIKLYIAGNVSESDKIISQNVKYLGWIKKGELNDYIAGAEFVISSSQLPETFGLVALESIAQGTPFVGYKTGAYPEIIRDGENGFLVKDQKELIEVIKKMTGDTTSFKRKKIKKDALDKYNKIVYTNKLINIFKNLKQVIMK